MDSGRSAPLQHLAIPIVHRILERTEIMQSFKDVFLKINQGKANREERDLKFVSHKPA